MKLAILLISFIGVTFGLLKLGLSPFATVAVFAALSLVAVLAGVDTVKFPDFSWIHRLLPTAVVASGTLTLLNLDISDLTGVLAAIALVSITGWLIYWMLLSLGNTSKKSRDASLGASADKRGKQNNCVVDDVQ